MKQTTKAHLALLGANLFYGGGFTVAKQVMPRLITPNAFILLRVGVVVVLFWLFFLGGKGFRTIFEKKDWIKLVLGGLFGVALNQLLFFQGLNLTSPIHASVIMMSTPLLIVLFSAFALKEKVGALKISGLILGITGAVLLATEKKSSSGVQASALGDLFIFLNAASYSVYLVLIKPLMLKYRPLIIIRWVFLFGFLFVLPFSVQEVNTIDWGMFVFSDFMALAFIIICCTFLTYLWNAFALQHLSPSTAGAYIYLQPIFAAVISISFMNEQISMLKLVATLCMFTGVYLVTFGWPNKMRQKEVEVK